MLSWLILALPPATLGIKRRDIIYLSPTFYVTQVKRHAVYLSSPRDILFNYNWTFTAMSHFVKNNIIITEK